MFKTAVLTPVPSKVAEKPPKLHTYDELMVAIEKKPVLPPMPSPATLETEFWDEMLLTVADFTEEMKGAYEHRGFMNHITPRDAICIFVNTIGLQEEEVPEDDEDEYDFGEDYEEV
jgi:hypothetical protein